MCMYVCPCACACACMYVHVRVCALFAMERINDINGRLADSFISRELLARFDVHVILFITQ
jgi:hypothetical protein